MNDQSRAIRELRQRLISAETPKEAHLTLLDDEGGSVNYRFESRAPES